MRSDSARAGLHDVSAGKERHESDNGFLRRQIGFGDNDVIRHSHLFQRYGMTIQMALTIHGIDCHDDAIDAKVMPQHGIGRNGE